jgi:hypothetical protein
MFHPPYSFFERHFAGFYLAALGAIAAYAVVLFNSIKEWF